MSSEPRPHVQRLLQRLVALVFVIAFASLGAQVHVLIGSRGLLPIAALAERLPPDTPFSRAPSLFLHHPGDLALTLGIAAGVALSLAALVAVFPRVCLALATALYLSFAVACRDFLSFQWDNLLLECGLLAALLPRERRAAWVLFLFRVLLFKLYFESGIAKWQSYLHDWQDGSAMTFYYETAPLPTRLAWYAHHLPAPWHHLESWGTLAFELGGPLLIFGPRRARLAVCAVFTGFQLVNIATANYGFFSYLALVLHVVLLDDRDVPRLRRALRRHLARALPRRTDKPLLRLRARHRLLLRVLRKPLRRSHAPTPAGADRATLLYLARLSVAAVVTPIYLGVSLDRAQTSFFRESPRSETLGALSAALTPFRVVNTYHLFGHITRERIEPTFETFDGATWTAHDLRYKPGDPERAPPFVAPHQPRVDFSLWFYGLSHQRGTPEYVRALVEALCYDPTSVQGLFPGRLPASPEAARITFHEYRFTTFAERWSGPHAGAYWTRSEVAAPREIRCAE